MFCDECRLQRRSTSELRAEPGDSAPRSFEKLASQGVIGQASFGGPQILRRSSPLRGMATAPWRALFSSGLRNRIKILQAGRMLERGSYRQHCHLFWPPHRRGTTKQPREAALTSWLNPLHEAREISGCTGPLSCCAGAQNCYVPVLRLLARVRNVAAAACGSWRCRAGALLLQFCLCHFEILVHRQC